MIGSYTCPVLLGVTCMYEEGDGSISPAATKVEAIATFPVASADMIPGNG